MEIRFVAHKEIDFQKWNACIKQSQNGLIYGMAEYLTSMCEWWDALILEDYQAVMPLTRRTKWGIDYLYQPSFVQQGGVFGNINEIILEAFLSKSKQLFKFGEIHLNYKNQLPKSISKKNQIIHLHHPYTTLIESYSNHTKRKIDQARNRKTVYQQIDPIQNIDAYEKRLGSRTPHVTKNIYDRLIMFCQENPKHCISRGLFLDGTLASSITALKDDKRIYILTPVNHNAEKYSFTSHALIDQLMNEFSEQDLILDFEGSDIPGVFTFNESFGAIIEPYYFYRWNRLPWPIHLLKG